MSEPERFGNAGNDYIAGGPQDDTIFGQLGDDTIQGDGSIEGKLTQNPVGADRNSDGILTVISSSATWGRTTSSAAVPICSAWLLRIKGRTEVT